MEDKNNGGLTLQSIGSMLETQSTNSAESLVEPENKRKTHWSTRRIFVTTLDVINHALIILVTSYLVYHAGKQYSVTNVHVILCTIGYVLLMSEAIVALAGENILTNVLSRRAHKHIHWVLQALGLIFNLVGVGVMYNVKSRHLLSIHAIVGFASMVIACVLAVFGYPVMIAVQLRKIVRPVVIRFTHNFLGIACFVIGMIAQCYGYKKRWVYDTTHVENADTALLVLTAIITLLSLRGALFSLANQTVTLLRSLLAAITYEDVETSSPLPRKS